MTCLSCCGKIKRKQRWTFWFDVIAIHSLSDLMGSDTRYDSSEEKNKKSIWDHQFTTEEKELEKTPTTQLQICNVRSLYLSAEIPLPQFWLRDPAIPQIHSLVKFSQHPIRKKKKKKVSQFGMKKTQIIRRFGLENLNRLRTNLTHIRYFVIRSTLGKLGEENLIAVLIVVPEVYYQVSYHIAFL